MYTKRWPGDIAGQMLEMLEMQGGGKQQSINDLCLAKFTSAGHSINSKHSSDPCDQQPSRCYIEWQLHKRVLVSTKKVGLECSVKGKSERLCLW